MFGREIKEKKKKTKKINDTTEDQPSQASTFRFQPPLPRRLKLRPEPPKQQPAAGQGLLGTSCPEAGQEPPGK